MYFGVGGTIHVKHYSRIRYCLRIWYYLRICHYLRIQYCSHICHYLYIRNCSHIWYCSRETVETDPSKVSLWWKAMAAKYKIEKFNGNNFSLWKMKIKVVLRKNNCLVAIRERLMKIPNDKWNEIDGNVISNLHLALVDGVLSSVVKKKITNKIWDTFTKLYEAKSLHNTIFLNRRLCTLWMVESTSVTNHINILKTLFSQLTMLGHNIGENEHAELLL